MSTPRTPTDVKFDVFTALKAYSEKYLIEEEEEEEEKKKFLLF